VATEDEKDMFPRQSAYAIATHPSESEQDRDELTGVLTDVCNQNNIAQWPRALQYFQNSAFVLGQHFLLWNFNGQTLSTTTPRSGLHNSDVHVPKTVDNQLVRPFEATISMLSSTKPIPRITPRSDDPIDEDAASLAEVALDTVWEDPLRMQFKVRQLSAELALTGTAAVEVVLEDTGSYSIPMPKRQEIEVEDEILGKILKEVEVEGEEEMRSYSQIRATVYNAFQIIPDPHATADPDTMNFIGIQVYVDKGWVQLAYDKDEPGYYRENLEKISSADGVNSPLYWNERIRDLIDCPNEVGTSMIGRTSSLATGGASSQDIVLRIFDVKPNSIYPKGRTIVFAGGQLIYCSPKEVGSRAWNAKYPERWTPLVIFRYWTLPGRFWGLPLMTPLVPLQRRINAIDSLVQLNRQFMTLGQWLLPNTARVPDGFITGIPGQHIPYKVSGSGAKPERVPNSPLPAELLVERDLLASAIQKISGINEIMQGNQPNPNVRSGAMLDFLKSQALQSKTAIFQGFEEGLQEVAKNILIEISIGLTDMDHPLSKRITMAARNHAAMAIQHFQGADLRDNTMVRFDIASAILKSPEAKEQKAQEFLQYAGSLGILGPQEIRRVASIMGLEELMAGQNLHIQKVRRMVSLIKQGYVQAVGLVLEGVEDPGIAAEVIRSELLRPSFMNLGAEIQGALMDLFETYQRMQSERVAQMAEIQMAVGGAPPPGSQQSPEAQEVQQ